jgi:hypothetical protein
VVLDAESDEGMSGLAEGVLAEEDAEEAIDAAARVAQKDGRR